MFTAVKYIALGFCFLLMKYLNVLMEVPKQAQDIAEQIIASIFWTYLKWYRFN